MSLLTVAALLAVVVLLAVILIGALRDATDDGHGPDDGGGGGSKCRAPRPRQPPGPGDGTEDDWWPAFEQDFAEHCAQLETERPRTETPRGRRAPRQR